MKKKLTLSACMMVKNEEEMLPRCLNSIKHIVDEIIVVDTGSTDGTVAIAQSFGAKIYHHPWEQDFSKHRNQSIGYATGDWLIIIDADEELDAYNLKKEDLKKRLNKAPKELHCFLIKLVDKDIKGNIAATAKSARIFRNRVGVEYRGIVHNTAYYSGKVMDIDLQMFHYGYALTEAQMHAKYRRTSSLLLRRVENDPKDYAAYYYLCQVYMEMKEYQQALSYAKRCLDILPTEDESGIDVSFYYSLYHNITNLYISMTQYNMAEDSARKGLTLIPDEIDLYYDLAYVGHLTKNTKLTIEGGEKYLGVLDEFRSSPLRGGTRFVFSTSREVQLTVEYWLMSAYISIQLFNDAFKIWQQNREFMSGKLSAQPEILSNFEIASTLHQRVEQNPEDYPAYFYLSQIYMRMKDEDRGIDYAQKCLNLLRNTNTAETVKQEHGKTNASKADTDISFYYSIYHILALALINQNDYANALDIVREGLEQLPDEIDLLYDLACTGYFLNDPALIIEGGESYLQLVDNIQNKDDNPEQTAKDNPEQTIKTNPGLAVKDGNSRFISTTDASTIFSVKCWLMLAFIELNRSDDYASLWEQLKEQLVESKDTIYKFTDYTAIFLNLIVIVAESLLKQNEGRKFLEISSFILQNYVEHQLEGIKGTAQLASAYNLLAQQQDKTERGILTALSCLDIAWILTDGEQYLEAIKKLKENKLYPTQEIHKPENKSGSRQLDNNKPAGKHLYNEKSANNQPAYNAPASFRTSFTEVNITPKVSDSNPVFLQGMAVKDRKATGVGLPLKMQMLLIEDGHYTKLLIVSADIFGFGNEMVELVRNTASGWGIAPEGIILNASHTHYAPGTVSHASRTLGPYFKEYAVEVAGIICKSLTTLYDNLQESCIYSGQANVSVGINRRLETNGKIEFSPNENGSYDHHTPFLLIEQKLTNKRIIMVNHGCHPTGLGAENNLSADFPGYFRDELINTGKVEHVMYLQGASGDIKEATTVNGKKAFSNTSLEAGINGSNMAKCVESALDNGSLIPLTDSSIACTSQTMYLPLKKIPDINKINEIKNDQKSDTVIGEWASRLSANYPSGNFPDVLALDVQTVSIGKNSNGERSIFISFPAEPLTDLGVTLKSTTDSPATTFILGYTNGLTCYLPDDKAISKGGYEAVSSSYYYMIPYLLEEGTESKILSAVKTCYSRINSPSPEKIYGRYHENINKTGKAFFTLSAGRCGTQTVAHLLDTASNAKVWHHPLPFLVNETYDAYYNTNDKRKIFWRARGAFIYKTWSEGLIHGETDHNMTPFCDVIAEDIPDSKFIVLVRNPWEFVRSGMRRNYYTGHPWDSGRLKPNETHPDYYRWNSMTQFEKICWLWNETYKKIFNIVDRIDHQRVLIIKFEDFMNNDNSVMQLFSFLNLESINTKKNELIFSQKLNRQTENHFPAPDEWDEEKLTILWNICRVTAERFNYHPNQIKIKQETTAYKKKDNQTNCYTIDETTTNVKNSSTNINTIWDFTKYPHQKYPDKELNTEFFMKKKVIAPLINKITPISSMGSCFARNIAIYLMQNHYNYLVTELPFQQASAHWDQVFNTACMRQIFEYTFLDKWNPVVRWWEKGNVVQDPFRRQILYNKESCFTDFEKHKRCSYNALYGAKTIILTLGLIETWRDKRDKMTFYRVPSPQFYDPDIHELHIQSTVECIADLNQIHELLSKNNPEASLIVTVSPVPLVATFRKDVDPITANSFSKSTLRVAAEYFANSHENVYYFPSYEIITNVMKNPYEQDNRHIKPEAIKEMMEIFRTWFMTE